MKRTKLTAASLPSGALPPTSTWYEVPRCFACDDPIKSHRFSTSLLQGRTQYSHSSIPGKLGEYIGDGFVVVVTSEDALCRNCMNLLNTMDRLEEDLKENRTRLLANLHRKYGLDPNNSAGVKLNRKQTPKVEKGVEEIREISGDEEWLPNNKKRRVVSQNSIRFKSHTCHFCKMEFMELSQFMAHLSKHKEQRDGFALSNDVKNEADTPKIFKCGCCTLSFEKKEALAIHMRLHTVDKQLNRTVIASGNQTASLNDVTSSVKTSVPLQLSNEAKPGSQINAQTVVEMKLIMDAESKEISSEATQAKGTLSKEQDISTPKVNENDSGGKVCLLALWNNGSCTDHPDCQKSSGTSANDSSGISTDVQQASHIGIPQAELFIPKIVMQQSEDGVPQVVVSQSEFKLPEVVPHPHYQMNSTLQPSAVSLVPNVPLLDTQYIAISEASSLPQVHINSDNCNSSSQVVVSIPNSIGGIYNPPNHDLNDTHTSQSQLFLSTKTQPSLTGIENGEPQNLQGGNGALSSLFSFNKDLELGQKSLNSCGEGLSEQTSANFSAVGQLPCQNLDMLNPVGSNLINDSHQNDKPINTLREGISPITERTIVEHDAMGNIAIVNVTSVEGNETTYSKDDVPEWFYNHEQSNAIIQPQKCVSKELWLNEAAAKPGMSGIDQMDGVQAFNTLCSDVKEQSDSVDEDELSEFFTSRYLLDS